MNGSFIKEELFYIAKDYITRMENLIDISKEIFAIITDKMFNVKLSLSIIKGGVIDYLRGHQGTYIYDEIKNIKDNLASSIKYLREIKIKIENQSNFENHDYHTNSNIIKQYTKNLKDFEKNINSFLIAYRTKILETEFDLIDTIQNKHLSTLSDNYIKKWYGNCVNLNEKGFDMIKKQRETTKKITDYIIKYKKKTHIEEKEQLFNNKTDEKEIFDEKVTNNEPNEPKHSEKLFYFIKDEDEENKE